MNVRTLTTESPVVKVTHRVAVAEVEEFVAKTPKGTVRLWLDDREGAGRVILMFDGEIWFHAWPHRGGELLRPWLKKCQLEQAAYKMRAVPEFDSESTEANFRRLVCQYRRDEQIGEEMAREIWDAIGDADTEDAAENWFWRFMEGCRGYGEERNAIVMNTNRNFAFAFETIREFL